ncbi:sensor histidine kinase [Bradyrhizobium prioriisuperbiae]|uniref:sensor histidine kinase n=1 Tax=Bradyrhizobium prioriisuperbiae TaxID=2854389 RepID=UPI0028ED8992|nr:ATP-binding protein [Bradyrhizobium prioritasuperba]
MTDLPPAPMTSRMNWARHLMPRSITAQITGLVAIAVLLGITLVVAVIWLLFDPPSRDDNPMFAAGRVTEITRLIRAAKSPADADALLAAIQRNDLQVRRVALTDLMPATADSRPLIGRLALRPLEAQSDIELLEGLRDPGGPSGQIITRLDAGHALVVGIPLEASIWPLLLTPTALLVIIVMFSMLLLSLYAVRWVIAPLADVASAAAAFGRSPQAHGALSRRGPREIMQVTDALNDMRTRIRGLLDDRTRMLAAISHDLRTPLTRLRLRTERVGQDSLRNAMLSDLTNVSRMLDETLEYLRDHTRSEAISRIDLPSFLQTICSDFADTGHAVRYAGPPRLSYTCRPRALSRAVTNIVENAVKHAHTVTVALHTEAGDSVTIEVSDDGPGIPAALRDKVFEPFFKVDNARRESSGGFGLGLSIAQEIIQRHGGRIEMRPAEPSGLRVLMVLPSATSPQEV